LLIKYGVARRPKRVVKREATLLDGVSPVVQAGGKVIGGGSNWSSIVNGVIPDYFTIRNWRIESSSAFTEKDVTGRRKVALLGKTVADELFASVDPIGRKIRIRNVPCAMSDFLSAIRGGFMRRRTIGPGAGARLSFVPSAWETGRWPTINQLTGPMVLCILGPA